jgi:hypothetical protein
MAEEISKPESATKCPICNSPSKAKHWTTLGDEPYPKWDGPNEFWEVYHDDDCDGVITTYPENLCLKCGMHPDFQSRGARQTRGNPCVHSWHDSVTDEPVMPERCPTDSPESTKERKLICKLHGEMYGYCSECIRLGLNHNENVSAAPLPQHTAPPRNVGPEACFHDFQSVNYPNARVCAKCGATETTRYDSTAVAQTVEAEQWIAQNEPMSGWTVGRFLQ